MGAEEGQGFSPERANKIKELADNTNNTSLRDEDRNEAFNQLTGELPGGKPEARKVLENFKDIDGVFEGEDSLKAVEEFKENGSIFKPEEVESLRIKARKILERDEHASVYDLGMEIKGMYDKVPLREKLENLQTLGILMDEEAKLKGEESLVEIEIIDQFPNELVTDEREQFVRPKEISDSKVYVRMSRGDNTLVLRMRDDQFFAGEGYYHGEHRGGNHDFDINEIRGMLTRG